MSEPRRQSRWGVPTFFLGVAMDIGGFIAFVYAHDHRPSPEVDPMAVHVVSGSAYNWLHDGGVVLIVGGGLLAVIGLVRVWRTTGS